MSNARPTLLSKRMAQQAMSDPTFYSKMPEFVGLKEKITAVKAQLERPGGCGGCRKRKIIRNVYREFMDRFANLNPEGIKRIKSYYGVEKFMIHGREKATGKAVVKIL